MKILAIDTTENTATCAILQNEELISSMQIAKTRNHSESMLPIIDSLLKMSRLTLDDIDLFAVSTGPGSFTGVRIGVATIKGLTFGKNKPIVGVSALEAMAWNHLGTDRLICPVMDARRGQVYGALLYAGEDEVTYEDGYTDDILMASDMLAKIKQSHPDTPITLMGGGMQMTAGIAKEMGVKVNQTPELLRYENAYGVGLCAYRRYIDDPSCTVSDRELAPTYLRASQAERERMEKEKVEK